MVKGTELARAQVLGQIGWALSDGRVVSPASVTQRRLLAVLARTPRHPVRAEVLAELTGLSASALRTSVARLRRLPGGGLIRTTPNGYVLDADTDASAMCAELERGRDLRALERALCWWSGPAFDEFAAEPWAAGEAARLHELHAGAVEDRAELLIDRGRAADALAELEAHVAAHPLRDRARGLHVRALAADGRQAEALRSYQQYRTLLVTETGTEPSAAVRDIERRVALGWDGRSDQAVAAGGEASSPATSTSTTSARTGPSRRRRIWVGRAAELATVDAAAARVVTERETSAIVVLGEAGIGKTSLLDEVARRARSGGAHVAAGRCDETAAVPLQPFRTVVEQLVDLVSEDELAAHRARHGELLAPTSLASTPTTLTSAPTSTDDATGRFLLFEAVADLTRRAAVGAPLVLVLDDLHWAEPTALQLLRHLARELTDVPVLFAIGARDVATARSAELRTTLADLDRHGAERIELTGFAPGELRELVAARLEVDPAGVGDDVVDALVSDTAGNPLLASHLVRRWVELGALHAGRGGARFVAGVAGELSSSLRDLVGARVAVLDPDAPLVLAGAAVAGVEFDQALVEEIVDVGPDTVERVLDAAVSSGLLVADGPERGLRFAHGLVARAVYADVPAPRRRRLHERTAAALEKRWAAGGAPVAGRVAQHHHDAGMPAEALTWCLRAGDEARRDFAAVEAAGWYRRALEHAGVLHASDAVLADILIRLGEAELRAGAPEAMTRLVDGAAAARRAGDRDGIVRAALASDLGFVSFGAHSATQLELVEAAVAHADDLDAATRARLHALLACSLAATPDARRREAAIDEALAIVASAQDPLLIARVAPPLLGAIWGPDTAPLRARIAADAVAAVRSSRDPYLVYEVNAVAYNAAVCLGDAATARSTLATLRDLVARHPAPWMRWMLGVTDTFVATMAADFRLADEVSASTLDLGMAIGEPDAFSIYAAQLFILRTYEGRHAEMLPIVEQIVLGGETLLPFRIAYAIACDAVGRHDVAQAQLAEGMADAFGGILPDMFWLTSIMGYAVLAIELRDAAAAAVLLPLIEPYAGQVSFNGGTSHGPISAYAGKLATLLGEHDRADAHLAAAMAMCDDFGWVYHRATTLIAVGESRLRRVGRIDAAVAQAFDEAARICAERGITNWAAKIEALRSEG